MKLSEILKYADVIEQNASGDIEIFGICNDSRRAEAGSLFVAVSGFESDGHRFIESAVKNGASAVLCERKPDIPVPYVIVPDCRRALADVSRSFYGDPTRSLTVIGITGTNGKTTSTYLIKHMLEEKCGARVGLIGTNGNMIGSEFIHTERTTPESHELQELFKNMLEAGCTHAVMEVSSHSLVLHRVDGIDFDVCAFTNLTQDHLDFHKTMEEYAKAKARLFPMSKGSVINADDEWSELMIKSAGSRALTYSAKDKSAGLYAENVEVSDKGVSFTAVTASEKERVRLGIPGIFSVYNALCVISVGLALGMSLTDCAGALKTAEGVKGRMELVPTDGDYTMVIDYSHTPDSLENAIKALKSNAKGRVVALFGCGGDRDKTKRPIMGEIAGRLADFTIVTSDNPRTEEPMDIINDILPGIRGVTDNYLVIPNRAEAIRTAMDTHQKGDIILLAGKGHEDYQEIGHEKIHLDEREVIKEHIEKRKMR